MRAPANPAFSESAKSQPQSRRMAHSECRLGQRQHYLFVLGLLQVCSGHQNCRRRQPLPYSISLNKIHQGGLRTSYFRQVSLPSARPQRRSSPVRILESEAPKSCRLIRISHTHHLAPPPTCESEASPPPLPISASEKPSKPLTNIHHHPRTCLRRAHSRKGGDICTMDTLHQHHPDPGLKAEQDHMPGFSTTALRTHKRKQINWRLPENPHVN